MYTEQSTVVLHTTPNACCCYFPAAVTLVVFVFHTSHSVKLRLYERDAKCERGEENHTFQIPLWVFSANRLGKHIKAASASIVVNTNLCYLRMAIVPPSPLPSPSPSSSSLHYAITLPCAHHAHLLPHV
uniref:Uncharacterized protein n=1 Tax=Glossina palpalis gambiensis TaxID=67801 RepID=A0A1B0BV17_9MUSC